MEHTLNTYCRHPRTRDTIPLSDLTDRLPNPHPSVCLTEDCRLRTYMSWHYQQVGQMKVQLPNVEKNKEVEVAVYGRN